MIVFDKKTMALADTEYEIELPLGIRGLAFKVRSGIGATTVRYSWTTGVVAAPSEVGGTYHSIDANTPTYSSTQSQMLHLADKDTSTKTLYVACSGAGKTLEVEYVV